MSKKRITIIVFLLAILGASSFMLSSHDRMIKNIRYLSSSYYYYGAGDIPSLYRIDTKAEFLSKVNYSYDGNPKIDSNNYEPYLKNVGFGGGGLVLNSYREVENFLNAKTYKKHDFNIVAKHSDAPDSEVKVITQSKDTKDDEVLATMSMSKSELKKNFEFYIIFDVDQAGYIYSTSNDEAIAESMFSRYSEEGIANIILSKNSYKGDEGINYKIQEAKNIKVVLTVKKKETSKFFKDVNEYQKSFKDINDNQGFYPAIPSTESVMIKYIAFPTLLVLIISLFLPRKELEQCFPINKLKNGKFEVLLLGSLAMILILFIGTRTFIQMLCLREFSMLQKMTGLSVNNARTFGSIGMFIAYFIYFFIAMFFIFMLKELFATGIIKYFKSKSIIIDLIRRFVRLTSKFANALLTRRYLQVIVGATFVGIIWSLFIFSTTLPLWYSLLYWIGVGILIAYNLKKIIIDLDKLKVVSHQISQGNLDMEIDEKEYGAFKELAVDFKQIRFAFSTAVEEEVKSQKMKSELITNVSHDLKTPLTTIISYVDLLKDPSISDEERKKYMDTLERSSNRLKHLIEDLFDVSKADSGNIKLNLQELDIVSLMQQVQLEYQERFDEQQIELRSTYEKEPILMQLDAEKTYRIFENLYINASRYALSSTRVFSEVNVNGEDVVITIKNIAKDEILFDPNDLLERFVQGDESRNKEGSGLGLAIVKSFVEVQNGEFFVEVDGDMFKAVIVFKRQ